MKLTITRTSMGDQGTPGRAVLDVGVAAFCSLELPWRGNAHEISCIPAGVYDAAWLYSEHFGRNVYHLLNVPNRTTIEIHKFNWAGDAALGWVSNSEGCIGLGQQLGKMAPPPDVPSGEPHEPQLALLYSLIALTDFHRLTQGQPLTVVMQWADGANPEGN